MSWHASHAGIQEKKNRLKYLLIIFREIRGAQLQSTGECRSSDETDPHGAVWACTVHMTFLLLAKAIA